jgi:hypothetical protein
MQILHDLGAGAFTENELREAFTVSERVAIAVDVEAEIGNRQGQRSDLAAQAAKLSGRTDDEVARLTGFGSAETLKRAQTVVDKGASNVIDAVDKGQKLAQRWGLPPGEPLARRGRGIRPAAEHRQRASGPDGYR